MKSRESEFRILSDIHCVLNENLRGNVYGVLLSIGSRFCRKPFDMDHCEVNAVFLYYLRSVTTYYDITMILNELWGEENFQRLFATR